MIGLDDPGVTKLSLENLVVTVDNEFLRRMSIRNCSSQFLSHNTSISCKCTFLSIAKKLEIKPLEPSHGTKENYENVVIAIFSKKNKKQRFSKISLKKDSNKKENNNLTTFFTLLYFVVLILLLFLVLSFYCFRVLNYRTDC